MVLDHVAVWVLAVWHERHVTLELCVPGKLLDVCAYLSTGSHEVVEWHALHSTVVTKCPDAFPVAVVPLWQLEHFPVIVVWSTFTLSQLVVEVWHASHWAVV